MDEIQALTRHLSELDEAQLAALLGRRADAMLGVAPRSLDELAHRLWHPHSLVSALRTRPLPCLQLLHAAQALGNGCSVDALATLLDGDGDGDRPGHRHALDAVVDELAGLAVLVLDGPDVIMLPPALNVIMPDALGLGEPLRDLLRDVPVDAMRRIQTTLGLPTRKSRAGTVDALVKHFDIPGNVAAVLSSAPQHIREWLGDYAERLRDDEYVFGHDQQWYRVREEARQWGQQCGVFIRTHYSYEPRMPAQVTRVLLGAGFRAPFTPRPPRPAQRSVDASRVEQGSAAAVSAFAAHLLAVLDHLARSPAACVKSGGIGARELTKLTKATDANELEVRLALELADELSLIDQTEGVVTVSPAFDGWRDLEPGERLAGVLHTWWSLARMPTESRDADGTVLRALARSGNCDSCRLARRTLVAVLAESGSTTRESLAPCVTWRSPFVDVVARDADKPFATPWAEAERLGVIVDGALSQLGRALLGDPADLPDLADLARRMLPAASDRATFGSDLTAYVAGAPTGRLSALLDSAADRESSGGATTWRFSPASVRRAFDGGTTSDELLAALDALALRALPQPLRYLVEDVARRHGNLRLTEATCVISSDDEALLAEVASDRKLAKLGPRLIAPTVLTCGVSIEVALGHLRSRGYFPVAEADAPAPTRDGRRGAIDTPASVPPPRTTTPIPAGPTRAPSAPDAAAVASSLLSPRSEPANALGVDGFRGTELVSATELIVARLARSLSAAEIRQLAYAIDTRNRVAIEYVSASGARTIRVINDPELAGPTLTAWCEMRADERMFTMSRIVSVAAV